VVKDLLKASPRLQERVLYGSDFSINLLATNTKSYDENLTAFAGSALAASDKAKLSETNPARFLFGE